MQPLCANPRNTCTVLTESFRSMSTPFYPLLQLAQSLRIKFTSQELWIRIIFERKDSVSTGTLESTQVSVSFGFLSTIPVSPGCLHAVLFCPVLSFRSCPGPFSSLPIPSLLLCC